MSTWQIRVGMQEEREPEVVSIEYLEATSERIETGAQQSQIEE